MKNTNKKPQWKIEGHYPGLDSHLSTYHSDAMFTETSIKFFSVKLINSTIPNCALCSYADFLTSGQLSAHWDYDQSYDEYVQLQRHDCFELQYVVKGTARGMIEQTPFLLKEGDLLFLNRNIRNLFHYEPNSILMTLSFTNDYLNNYFIKNKRFHISPPLFSDFIYTNLSNEFYENKDYLHFTWKNGDVTRSDSYQLMHTMFEELRGKKPGYEYLISGLILRLFHSFANTEVYDILKVSTPYQNSKELVEAVKKYLDANKRKLTSRELSDHFYFNGKYLCRIFKHHMKQSLHSYNQHIYMEEALELLRTTDFTIENIAVQVGFSSRTYFYNAFQKYYGNPPSFYRK